MLSVWKNSLVLSLALLIAIPTPSYAGPIRRGLHAVGAVARGAARVVARGVGKTALFAGRVAAGAVRGVARGLRRTALFFHYRRPVRRAVAAAFGFRPCGGFACGRLRYY